MSRRSKNKPRRSKALRAGRGQRADSFADLPGKKSRGSALADGAGAERWPNVARYEAIPKIRDMSRRGA